MKRFFRVKLTTAIILSLIFLSTSALATQIQYPKVPANGQFIADEANIIDAKAREFINSSGALLLEEKHIPVVAVTINSLRQQGAAALGIERYTYQLFNHWELGYSNRNYGVILLLAVNDRKARIEFGKDWDHRYDRQAKIIMNNYLVPHFKRGQYSIGMQQGFKALNNLVRGLKLPPVETPKWVLPVTIVLGLLLVFVIISLFRNGRSGWGWALIVFVAIILWWLLRNSGGLSGGGSGGGGGATGSW